MPLAGRATAQGTARYAARMVEAGAATRAHYRTALGLTLSSIGYGTAEGEITDAVDDALSLNRCRGGARRL